MSPRRRSNVTEMDPDAVMAMINREFGEGTMMLASDPSLEVVRLETGVLSIDVALGGGLARGRTIEIYGVFAVGKSYLAERLVAAVQAAGGNCAWIDAEKTFDPKFARQAGVKLRRLMYQKQRQHGEELINSMEILLRSDTYDVIVLDSIASLLPKSEKETPMGAGDMGTAQARLMSRALRRLTTANTGRTVVVYINQTREAVGVMFGDRTVTSGGRAMGFYSSTRLEIVRTENIKRKGRDVNPSTGVASEKDLVRGHRALVRVRKDKTGGAMQQSTTSFVFDYDLQGIDHIEDLMYLGRVFGFITKSGNTWTLDGYEDHAKPSRAKFKGWLRRNTEVADELTASIKDVAYSSEDEEEPAWARGEQEEDEDG